MSTTFKKINRTKPLLVLPLEAYAREIDHKILLACFLSKATSCAALVAHSPLANKIAHDLGSSAVYIGKNIFVVPSAMPFDNSSSPRKLNNDPLYSLVKNDVKIIFVDEEGGLDLNADGSSEDYKSFIAYYPLSQEERFAKIPNFAMFHWGEYQHELARDFSPNICHFNAGANFIDAAKLYALPFAQAKIRSASLDTVEIGLTSNAAVLSNGAFRNFPSVLGIEWQAQSLGNNFMINTIRAESSLCNFAYTLSHNNYDMCYRPHPGSSNTIAREWIEYCKSKGIKLSFPSSESSLSYLNRIQTNVHLGCTTAIQSYFLDRKTLKAPSFDLRNSATSERLLVESKADSWVNLVDSLYTASVPQLGPVAHMLISNLDKSKLESFSIISDYLCNILEFSRNDQWRLRSIYKTVLKYEASRLKHTNAGEIGKYTRFHLSDVMRNLSIANQAWPTANSEMAFGFSNAVMISST